MANVAPRQQVARDSVQTPVTELKKLRGAERVKARRELVATAMDAFIADNVDVLAELAKK